MTDPQRPVARHARASSSALRIFVPIGIAVTVLGIILALFEGAGAAAGAGSAALRVPPLPVTAQELPVVEIQAAEVVDHCAEPTVQQALASGDDNAAVAAFGGGEAFRAAVATGNAPCVDLADPVRLWLVVNKLRSLSPAEYAPASLGEPALLRDSSAGPVRADVAAALNAMSDATMAAGLGPLALGSGYRSFETQVGNYYGHVDELGQEGADAVSARPGHSEHQTGLAADVVSCADGCGGIYDFGSTPAGVWVAENGWQYGFIVRYEASATASTGYAPEPWHLRYIGTELARAYHEGGYQSLEQFFALPDAPGYAD